MLKWTRPGWDRAGRNSSGNVRLVLLKLKNFASAAIKPVATFCSPCATDGTLIVRVLPSEAAEQRDGGVVGVLQITSNATANRGLESDVLFGALQEATEAGVEPVIPTQEAETAEI